MIQASLALSKNGKMLVYVIKSKQYYNYKATHFNKISEVTKKTVVFLKLYLLRFMARLYI